MNFTPLISAEEMFKSIPPGMLGPISGIDYRVNGTVKPYEIRLEYNYYKLIKLINTSNLDYYSKRKWLIDAEFRMRLVAEGINLALKTQKPFNEYLDQGSFIIAMPNVSGFSTFLAEHIIHLEDYKISFFLDYQLLEYEKAFNAKFEFYALIEHFVIFQLDKSFPISFKQKISPIIGWLNTEYQKIGQDAYESYRYYGLSADRNNKEQGLETTANIENDNNDGNINFTLFPTINPKCPKNKISNYFNLLRKNNPKTGKPFLNNEAVEWIIMHFGIPKDIKEKPKFDVNISTPFLEIFFHVFYLDFDDGFSQKSQKSLDEYATFLKGHFYEEFENKSIQTIKVDFNRYRTNLYKVKSDKAFPNELDYSLDPVFQSEKTDTRKV